MADEREKVRPSLVELETVLINAQKELKEIHERLISSERSMEDKTRTMSPIEAEVFRVTVRLKVFSPMSDKNSVLHKKFLERSHQIWGQIDKLQEDREISKPTVDWANLEIEKFREQYTTSSEAAFAPLYRK